MAVINITPLNPTGNINTSGTDSVTFAGVGTLNIAGTPQAPIVVVLSSVAGIGLLETINISYADVTFGGAAGVTALANYNIGAGGTLRIASNVGISAGMNLNFTGTNSHLVIGNGINLNLLGTINGFGPGSNIDVSNPFVTYTYADNAGTNTGGTLTLRDVNGNTVQTVALNTGEFTASSFNVHADGTGGTLIDFATKVSTITATPATADLTVGGTVVLTLGTTAPVSITGGVPTLALSDGGVATYDAASSTSTSLVFRHTVAAGQNTADLTVTGVNLNGASITDLVNSPVNLAGGVTNPAGILQIDTTAPTVASVTTLPGSGSLAAGQLVTINVTPSEAVTVSGGTPTLILNDGGTASYDAASSTPTLLAFKYTVLAGQNTADLTVMGANLNGAVVVDGAGNPINLSGIVANPAGILQIDTIAPTVASVTTTPGSGVIAAGQVVAFNVASSEAVAVVGGTPTLTLNDGGVATYDAASSTPTKLVFKYTVQPGQNTPDLTVTGTALNGATIADPAGNVLNLSAAVGNPPGVLKIDTTLPFVTSVSDVTTTPGSGDLTVGGVVALRISLTGTATVTGGPPTLTLSDGGTATYDAGTSTSTSLNFLHTVQSGQNTADLAVTGISLNGAQVTDGSGNAVDLSGSVTNPGGILQIDTIVPTITTVATTPASGALSAGQIVAINVSTSEAVTVSGGTPTLTLNDGGIATYDPTGSTSMLLSFKYTVQAGQNTADLTVTGANVNGATVADGAGNVLSLSAAVGNPAGTLQIDTVVPTITTVATTPGSGDLSAGQIVVINVATSKAVTVNGGTPSLTLNDGGFATYDPTGSTSTLLSFKYTVQAGQNTADLTVTGTNVNGATIADAAGNALSLSGAVGNPAGILQIDTTAPNVVSVSTSPGSGAFAAGQIVAINVAMSEGVTVVGGTPTLALNDGGIATYDAANSTPTLLVFNYTVLAGQNTDDLTIIGSSLNGATIADNAGNTISLSTAVGNPAGILTIDTTAPTIASVTTSPGSGTLAAGQVVSINVTPTEAVSVSGGTPTLTLSDGGTATYDPTYSTPTLLVFKHVVQPGQNTADLTITAANLNGATIADPAGNQLSLSGAVGNPPGILQIDTTRPAVTSVYGITATPGTADLGAGGIVVFQVSLTGNATVTGGTPSLTLNDGGTANYDATNSTATSLIFRHTVQPGQNTPDLTVAALALNGASVTDGSGNAVDLSGAVANPTGILQIDTTVPTITATTTAPGNGSLSAGQMVVINVATSEAVTVSGGTPTLTLNDGGVATYDPATSTSTLLAFRYTILPSQNTADLTVVSASLNGATIADGAGNALNFASAVGNPAGILQIDTIAPTVIATTTQPNSGSVTVGQIVSINVTPSESITVNGGTPTLTLNDGGIATYDAASSTPTLMVFKYTVQVGQSTNDLTITASSLNGASITDAAGNALDLSGAVGNPAGTLQVNTASTVTSVVTVPANGDFRAGSNIVIQVSTSGPVAVAGAPTLSLNDGGTAIYDAANSTATVLVFNYTVQSGENTPDLAVTSAPLNGATITDGFGQTVSLDGAVGNPAGTLQIDTIRPTAIDLTETRLLQTGEFRIVINYSEPVTIAGGPPTFFLSNGGTAVYRPLVSTPTTAMFIYTAPAGQSVAVLTVTGFDSQGAVATDGAGNLLDDGTVGAALAAAQGNVSDITGTGSPTTIDVYRFFDAKTGTHFYTQDPAERASVLATQPNLIPEGPNGVGLTAINPASNDPNAVAVYRFFDLTQGTHFFTASTSERDAVIATRRDLVYEPSSVFYEHVQPQTGDTAVYRFFDTKFGTHFYTDDPKERAMILQNRPDLVAEGIGFYEPARNPAT